VGQQSRTVEKELARMASRAHGVVTRAELLGAGISAKEVRQRLGTGTLIAVFRGVYRVGHTAPSVEARYLAAVLACGEGAVLSGRAAAHLWGLLKGPAPPLEVTAPTERRVKGVKTRRARRAKRETTTWRGIPVTTPARTLVDLAAVVDAADLARACHEAGVRHRTTPKQVEAVLARRPNAPGAGRLRAVLRGEVHVTLSKLESRFLDCLRAAAGSTAAGPSSG
jgi:predicted transcriptional regulator of viral defense system